ncbi:glycosyltransferase family 39 protein [Sulfuritortus calidifontis]|nr:glycosyltransferase family 39 protein [Sulfuritortus calidifontis]
MLQRLDTRSFLLIVGLYVLLHFGLRLVFSPVLGTDDVEQAICAQSLALGCDLRQPPLYTWLQWLTNQIAGPGLAGIYLLKYGLLFLTYLCLYFIGRRLFSRTATAALAALSLWLTYPFAVSVHQGVTHSLLLSLLLAASFLAFLRLEAHRHWMGYLLLGTLLGLGELAKYSFVLYAAALALAALSLPRYRTVLLDRRIVLTLAAGLLVVAPHGLWAWGRLDALHGALAGLGQQAAPSAYLPRVASGLTSLASALIQFLFPLWLILLLAFPRAFRPLAAAPVSPTPALSQRERRTMARYASVMPNEPLHLIGRTLLIGILLLALVVLLGGPVEIKARWMHVLLLLAPLWLFGRVEAAYGDRVAKTGYLVALLLLPALVIAAWAAQTYLAPQWHKPTRFHAPYDQLASLIRQTSGFERGTIVANELHLAGNLRLFFPEARVVTPAYPQYLPPAIEAEQCLLVWEEQNDAGMPPALQAFLDRHGKPRATGSPVLARANYRYSETEILAVGYLVLPAGDCP